MNLYFRMIWRLLVAVFAHSKHGKHISFPNDVSNLWFRVMPLDCDVNGHMTHSRYSSFSDIGRFDWAIRSGIGALVRKHKWAPMIANIQWEYRRELKPFERFSLETRFLGWDGSNFLAEHIYSAMRDGKKILCTRGLARVGFYDRAEKRFIEGDELAQLMGYDLVQPVLGEVEALFLKTRLTTRPQ